MNKAKRFRQLILGVLFLSFSFMVFLPVGNTLWSQVLYGKADVHTGLFIPTPTNTLLPTPTDTPIPTNTPIPSCVNTHGYWKNHPEDWPRNTLTFGEVTYGKEELMGILGLPTDEDATIILARQLIAAKLNMAKKDISSQVVEEIVVLADEWFSANPLYGELEKEEKELGINLAENLALFNEGERGYPQCDGQLVSVEQPEHVTLTITPTLTQEVIENVSLVITPAETPTVTLTPTGNMTSTESVTLTPISTATSMPTGTFTPTETPTPTFTQTSTSQDVEASLPTETYTPVPAEMEEPTLVEEETPETTSPNGTPEEDISESNP